jgi:hypothetical protein
MVCKSLALALEDVADRAVLPVGVIGFAAFSGGELLTLKVLLCCAKPLTLIPATTTATANEDLIFDPLPGKLIRRATLSLDARSLPSRVLISSMLNPPPPESTRENRNKGNGIVGTTVRATRQLCAGWQGRCNILHIVVEFPGFNRPQKTARIPPCETLITLHNHGDHPWLKAASDWTAAWCNPASEPTGRAGSPPSHPRSVHRARSSSNPPS